jgi:hypothetical protein
MAVINFMVVPPSALHTAHAMELADVVFAREQSRAYRGKARDGQCRSREMLHGSSLTGTAWALIGPKAMAGRG